MSLEETPGLGLATYAQRKDWGFTESSHLQGGREPSPDTNCAGTLIFDCWPPELWENKCLLSRPVGVIWSQQAEQTAALPILCSHTIIHTYTKRWGRNRAMEQLSQGEGSREWTSSQHHTPQIMLCFSFVLLTKSFSFYPLTSGQKHPHFFFLPG